MGRRAQFFIISAVIIILILLSVSTFVRSGYPGSSERPSQEVSILRDFNQTIAELYARPYSFRRNIEVFQLGIQKGSGFSSQIYLLCNGLADCSALDVGGCAASQCNATLKVVGPAMQATYDFSSVMQAAP